MRRPEWREYVWWYWPALSWVLTIAVGVLLAIILALVTVHWQLWYLPPIIYVAVALAYARAMRWQW